MGSVSGAIGRLAGVLYEGCAPDSMSEIMDKGTERIIDLESQLAAALEREEGLYKENRWLRGVDIAPLREHDGKRILCVDPDKFNQLIEKQLLGESTIADLRANLVAARDCFAQAYASGYQGGHNDTVEGQYGDPCELGIEYVDENLGEYDWLSATPKPLAVVEGYVYLRGEFGAAPWCRVDIEGHEKTVMLDFHKDESEAWPGTFAKAIILPAAQGETL